ncbi:MAG: carboxymuconolactone decarboxylase family protein [Candidatus Tectomicrobia bacterium]|nr:carboxymuconolactone decarboxylase family protein [Candidatus Tectomicrobia bacterium]
MAYIRQIEPAEATGELKEHYDRLMETSGRIPNIVKLSSLRPSAMRAAQGLYRAVLYEPSGLTRAQREMVATVVSAINGCGY